MAYTGQISETLQIKQDQLELYLGAQKAFAAGAQSYKIGSREITYIDPEKLQKLINQLMLEIVRLQNNGRRKSIGVVLKDY